MKTQNADRQKFAEIIKAYEKTWNILWRYDDNNLEEKSSDGQREDIITLTHQEASTVITMLREDLLSKNESSNFFGQERNAGLQAILGNIAQTFAGQPVYPSHQSRAAHLLYFIIKDHPFGDGNKRIGCLLFLIYLKKCGIDPTVIDNNSLTAIALLIAESKPSHKEIMVQLVIQLIGLTS